LRRLDSLVRHSTTSVVVQRVPPPPALRQYRQAQRSEPRASEPYAGLLFAIVETSQMYDQDHHHRAQHLLQSCRFRGRRRSARICWNSASAVANPSEAPFPWAVAFLSSRVIDRAGASPDSTHIVFADPLAQLPKADIKLVVHSAQGAHRAEVWRCPPRCLDRDSACCPPAYCSARALRSRGWIAHPITDPQASSPRTSDGRPWTTGAPLRRCTVVSRPGLLQRFRAALQTTQATTGVSRGTATLFYPRGLSNKNPAPRVHVRPGAPLKTVET
jgi:hypothetical protein